MDGSLLVIVNSLPLIVSSVAEFVNDILSLNPVLLQLLVFGILLGAMYGLVAMGLTLIYGVMDIINVAHGMFIGVGMYLIWEIWRMTGLHPVLLVVPTVVVGFFVGLVVYRLTIDPLLDATASSQVIVLLGILFIIQSGLQIIYSSEPRSIDQNYDSLEVAGAFIPRGQLFALGVAVTTVVCMAFLLYRTELGRAIRATADDGDSARFTAINVPRVNYITFGIGIALAVLAGATIATFQSFDPFRGNTFLLYSFIVAVLGGLGSFSGALVAGILIGLVSAFGSYYLPGTTHMILIFAIFIATLFLRPQGLFGSVVNQ